MNSQQMTFFAEQDSDRQPLYRGGFPCQPHSKGGKRRASSDERDLWHEMRRVIGDINPEWVVGENVRGILSSENGRYFGGILRDFSSMGYDVGWCCLRASEFGAIHSRERIGIIAHSRQIKHMDRSDEERGVGRYEQAQYDFDASPETWGGRCNLFEPKLLRTIDGIPHWVDRIECIGNAVCPPQFFSIFQAIANTYKEG